MSVREHPAGLTGLVTYAREFIRLEILNIHANADEVRQGSWHPEGGGGADYCFFRKGPDVVVTDGSGNFVTILRGGHIDAWYQSAGRLQ